MNFFDPTYASFPSPSGGIPQGSEPPAIGSPSTRSGLPDEANMVEQFLGPSYLAYPMATATPPDTAGGAVAPASGTSAGSASGALAPTTPLTPAAMGNTAADIAARAGAAAAAAAAAAGKTVVKAYCYNPRFTATATTRKEEEAALNDASPLSFTTPLGCTVCDLTFGAVELVPGGDTHDLAQLVRADRARFVDASGVELDDQAIKAGQEFTVTIPWRGTTRTELEPHRLRMAVYAHFS